MSLVINTRGDENVPSRVTKKNISMKSAAEIKQIIESIIQDSELFLVDIHVSVDNTIEVEIDSMKGVNVETCRTLNKQIEEILDRDVEDFSLTVYSAGIGYPFKVPQQYIKNIGNRVEVLLTNGQKTEGILKAYNENAITLETQEKQKEEGKKNKKIIITLEKEIPLTDIKEVKDIIIF